eukprot:scaffold249806_cov49-Prasinocladus_malaysianus.AAC.2
MISPDCGVNDTAFIIWCGIQVKSDHEWNDQYASIRMKSINVTISEGFVPGSDLMSLPYLDGFVAEWLEPQATLRVSLDQQAGKWEDASGYYDDDGVVDGLVDISQVLANEELTASLDDFSSALQAVTFETFSSGSKNRVFELSVQELLSGGLVSKISLVTVINQPDPPMIDVTQVPGRFLEKAHPTSLDPGVKVRQMTLPPIRIGHYIHQETKHQ